MDPLRKWTSLLLASGLLALLAACGGAKAAPTATPSPVKTVATATTVAARPTATPTKAVAVATPTTSGTTPLPTGGAEVVQVIITENPYAFIPNTFSFQRGKTYTLQFNVTEEFHTFTVADLGIDIYVDPGRSIQQAATFSKTGTFRLVCTVHQDIGQTGTVTVS